MGGDKISFMYSSAGIEEDSSLDQQFVEHPHRLPNFLNKDALSEKVEDDSIYGEFDDLGRGNYLDSVIYEAHQRHKRRVYAEVWRSYDDLQRRSERLEEAKRKILSYTPGSWIEKASGTKMSDYDIPKVTSFLLIGPKGSGKSSLVNKVSRAFEDDIFASERAQVSCDSSVGDGTYFIQEYIIPRHSGAFSLYDTRGFSDKLSENMKSLKHWMTKGVQHGEPVLRDSDPVAIKRRMKCKARLRDCYSREAKMVNFVIFVVNGLSVLEAVDGDDKTKKLFTEMIRATFNSPFLSFKDDKPVIVVTHGDLLSISDRIRVRVHLGDLLGIPPDKQIFDIPASDDRAAELAIFDMIRYCLEHADRNIPRKGWSARKIHTASWSIFLFMLMLGITIISAYVSHYALTRQTLPSHTSADTYEKHGPQSPFSHPSESSTEDSYDWRAIRHLWLGQDYD